MKNTLSCPQFSPQNAEGGWGGGGGGGGGGLKFQNFLGKLLPCLPTPHLERRD